MAVINNGTFLEKTTEILLNSILKPYFSTLHFLLSLNKGEIREFDQCYNYSSNLFSKKLTSYVLDNTQDKFLAANAIKNIKQHIYHSSYLDAVENCLLNSDNYQTHSKFSELCGTNILDAQVF